MSVGELRSLERTVRMAIFDVGEMLHLDVGWMNDAVKIYASENETYSSETDFGNGALKVLTPSLECLLAMKCLSLRDDESSKDREDIRNILKETGINSIDVIVSIVKDFFPNKKLSSKNLFTIKEILEDVPPPAFHP